MFKRQLKAGKTKKLSGKSFRLKGSNLMFSTPGEDYSPPPEKLTVRAVQTVVVLVRGHEGPDQHPSEGKASVLSWFCCKSDQSAEAHRKNILLPSSRTASCFSLFPVRGRGWVRWSVRGLWARKRGQGT